jgi:Ribosomal protein L20
MARTKRGVTSRAKHNKVLKTVKGQYGRRKNTIRIARQAMEKAMQYAYRDRKTKKENLDLYGYKELTLGLEPKV